MSLSSRRLHPGRSTLCRLRTSRDATALTTASVEILGPRPSQTAHLTAHPDNHLSQTRLDPLSYTMAAPPVPPRPFDDYDQPRRSHEGSPPALPPLPPDFHSDQYQSGPHYEDPLVAPRPHKLQPDLPQNVRPDLSPLPLIVLTSCRWRAHSTNRSIRLPSNPHKAPTLLRSNHHSPPALPPSPNPCSTPHTRPLSPHRRNHHPTRQI